MIRFHEKNLKGYKLRPEAIKSNSLKTNELQEKDILPVIFIYFLELLPFLFIFHIYYLISLRQMINLKSFQMKGY